MVTHSVQNGRDHEPALCAGVTDADEPLRATRIADGGVGISRTVPSTRHRRGPWLRDRVSMNDRDWPNLSPTYRSHSVKHEPELHTVIGRDDLSSRAALAPQRHFRRSLRRV